MSVQDVLPDEVPRNEEHGQQWHSEGRCVTCGGKKEAYNAYHCDTCYDRIWPLIADYDDD